MIKKMFLAALVSFPIFLGFFLGMDYLSQHRQSISFRLPTIHLAPVKLPFQRQWAEYQEQWRQAHDGRPAVLPSPTAFLPLEADLRESQLMKLFQTNAGCRFPCWWGIVPGKTSWEASHALLSRVLDSETQQYLSDEDHTIFTGAYYYHSFNLTVEFDVPDGAPVSDLLITDIPQEYLSNLTLRHLFQSYGMPGEINVRPPYQELAVGSCAGSFELFLYYPSENFAVKYSYESYPVRGPIRICGLDQPTYAEFYLWKPAMFLSFHEAAVNASWHPDPYRILNLEKQSGSTVESLYAAFQVGKLSDTCIDASPFDWSARGGTPNLYSRCEGKAP